MTARKQLRPHVLKLTYQLPQLSDGRWLSGEIFLVLHLPAGVAPRSKMLAKAVRPLLERLQAKSGLEGVTDVFVDIVADVPDQNALLWDERIIEHATECESTTAQHGRLYWKDDTIPVKDGVLQPLLTLRAARL